MPLGTNFSEILMEIYTFSFGKMHLQMSSGKWRPFWFSLILNVRNAWQTSDALVLVVLVLFYTNSLYPEYDLECNNIVTIFVDMRVLCCSELTYWCQNKMTSILQTTFSNSHASINLKCLYWDSNLSVQKLFFRIQLTIYQVWFIYAVLQGFTLSFLAGCPKSHFRGWYRNFLVYWYLKLDNQVVNSTCPKDNLGWIWRADDP